LVRRLLVRSAPLSRHLQLVLPAAQQGGQVQVRARARAQAVVLVVQAQAAVRLFWCLHCRSWQ
jgi:hypothetical protein